MAIIETVTCRTPGWAQPTVDVKLDDGGTGAVAASTIRYVDHTGATVSVPLTLDNARKVFQACAVAGSPDQRTNF